jgi:type II secretory pathway predicted ATPase ExeA
MATQPTLTADPIAALRGKYLTTAHDAAFRAHLDRVLAKDADGAVIAEPVRVTKSGETRGVLVTGEPGSGKTSIVQNAMTKHPAFGVADGAAPRWISLTVPSPATMKSLGLELLDPLGYPHMSPRETAWKIWQTVRHRIEMRGVTVVWIDEAHDLLNRKSPHETADMLKMLKSLMQGPAAVVVVLSGVPSLRNVIAQDQQVARRFSKLAIPPVSAAADAELLDRALRGYCRFGGVTPPVEQDLMLRIVHAGRGRLGRCLELMIGAIEVAVGEGATQLGQQHFAQRFAAQEGCDIVRNVFLSPRWSSLDLDAAA